MQRREIWFAFLGVLIAQPFFHNGLENDWETEAAYFVGIAVLE